MTIPTTPPSSPTRSPSVDHTPVHTGEPAVGPTVDTGPARRRSRQPGPHIRRPGRRPVDLTARDMLWLTSLARYGLLAYSQIGGVIDASPSAVRERGRKLAAAGLTLSRDAGVTAERVWRLTPHGLRAAGLDLPAADVSLGTVGHVVAVADLGVRFEVAAGETVVTAREIRAATQPGRQPTPGMTLARTLHGGEDAVYVGTLVQPGGSTYTRVPDLVLVRPPADDGSPQSVAIEVLLTRPSPAALGRMLRAYAQSHHIGHVVVYAHARGIASAISRAAATLGMADMIEIRRWTPATRGWGQPAAA